MTSKDRRRRELARQRYDRQQVRRSQREQKRRRRMKVVVWLTVAAMVIGTGVGVLLTLRADQADPLAATDNTDPSPTASGPCRYIDNAPDPSVVTDVGRPPSDPGDLGPLSAVLTLDGREVTVALDSAAAACTVNSWQFLADQDYFDDTTCHRLTTSQTLGVLQCGDPSGTGRGGPGYSFDEENIDDASYPAGTVAMANTGEPASTGSQFFLVHSDSELPALYTVVGSIVDGLEVVQQIAATGTVDATTDGQPAAPAVLEDLVVNRSDR